MLQYVHQLVSDCVFVQFGAEQVGLGLGLGCFHLCCLIRALLRTVWVCLDCVSLTYCMSHFPVHLVVLVRVGELTPSSFLFVSRDW